MRWWQWVLLVAFAVPCFWWLACVLVFTVADRIKQRRIDPLFGSLTRASLSSLWEGAVLVPAFGRQLALLVEAGRNGPDDLQRSLFETFRAKAGALEPKLKQAVFDYYREGYADLSPTLLEEPPLAPDDPERIWQTVEITTLSIPDQRRDPGHERLYLGFACEWDDEHGLEVSIRDWTVERIGQHGEV